MENPLVSVIIPVYNVEHYIKECLDSVLKQTYNNIEVILIDDGSKDGSTEVLKEYAETNEIFKLYVQENAGQSASRNKGIELAKGKYVYFLDADDFILPETISNLVTRAETHELDIVLFAAEPFTEDENVKIFKWQYDLSKYYHSSKVYQKNEHLELLQKGFNVSPCLYLIKKDVLINHNLRFKPGIQHEDELFSLKLYLNVNKAMYDPYFYYKRRYRSDSVMTTHQNKNMQRSFDSYWVVIKEMEKLLLNYTKPLERTLIKRRIGKLYSILAKSDLDASYKKVKLKEINELNHLEKLYYNVKGNMKKMIKKIIVR
ncbi:glycosyltransferase family 2 protein [Ornithinibacillus sp. 179-J 7C1 HS]|uniref:glycosyltransferase family 2 protein n=1 Tax=Ornithinibacillus sp. 179-J 7C1 HS TaxID=3142384 RepID=UPI0039A1ACDD